MIAYGRPKRLLLGGLALLAPLPLPFNELLEWPLYVVYSAVVLAFLRRAATGTDSWLRNWAMNVLGLAYLPILWLDFTALYRGQLVRPLLHLALFVLLVKLYALNRERDKWHALIGIFFVFLAAMGTSVHPSILLYMVAFLAASAFTLARFAYLHVLAGFGHRQIEPAPLPLAGFVTTATVATLAFAVPLFVVLPRMRMPYIVGRGTGSGTIVHAAGFSDEMSLDVASGVRDNRSVALRLQYEGALGPGELRYKAATYDVFQETTWRASPKHELRRERGSTAFHIAQGESAGAVRVFRQRMDSRALPLPVETLAVEVQRLALALDEGGAVSMRDLPIEPVEYRAHLASHAVSAALSPGEGEAALAVVGREGVTEPVAQLAARASGQGTPAERAARLEDYLIRNYAYTLDFVGRGGAHPVDDFLFRYKSGHCEYFASAMVLLLRSQDIPARLVTGFLGGEYNPLEGYFIVRQSNAHAWVEAWLGEEAGWRTFDPTPPSGRPSAEPASIGLLFSQAWDYVQFRWDRYVLTYGFYDQLQAFSRLRSWWLQLQRLWSRPERPAVATPAATPGEEQTAPLPASAEPAAGGSWAAAIGVALLLLAAAWILWRQRSPLTATRAYERLRRRLAQRGLPVGEATAPLALRQRAARRFPEAARPTGEIVELYLRESFAGETLAAEERQRLGAAVRDADQALGKRRKTA